VGKDISYRLFDGTATTETTKAISSTIVTEEGMQKRCRKRCRNLIQKPYSTVE